MARCDFARRVEIKWPKGGASVIDKFSIVAHCTTQFPPPPLPRLRDTKKEHDREVMGEILVTIALRRSSGAFRARYTFSDESKSYTRYFVDLSQINIE